MVQFSLFRIPITIQPFFWLTMGIFGFLFMGGQTGSQAILGVALFIIAGGLSVLVHELGHALMIKKYKLPTEIVLTTMGGYATYPPGILNRKQDFFVTLAGPSIQLILGIIALSLLRYLPNTSILIFFQALAYVSIFWAIFNCVPVFPLDGGKMLAAILGPAREKTVYLVGMITSIILIIVFVVIFPGSLFIPIFFGLFAFENWQRYNSMR